MRINVVSSEQLVVREMSSTHLSAEKQRRSENVSWSAEPVQQCSGCGRLGSGVVEILLEAMHHFSLLPHKIAYTKAAVVIHKINHILVTRPKEEVFQAKKRWTLNPLGSRPTLLQSG